MRSRVAYQYRGILLFCPVVIEDRACTGVSAAWDCWAGYCLLTLAVWVNQALAVVGVPGFIFWRIERVHPAIVRHYPKGGVS